MTLTQTEIGHLQTLEESLWTAATRFDDDFMQRTLAPDFFEFGCSGRMYTREETLAVPAQKRIQAKLPLPDFPVRPITEDVVQVTYTGEVTDDTVQICNRSSIWVKNDAGWQLRFHQGTPVPG